MQTLEPNFDHLLALGGPYGTFEHARYSKARIEHGYCTDDVARVLLVSARETGAPREILDLASSSLAFLARAQDPDGCFWNRRSPDGEWSGSSSSDDCWGRALWALGTTVARSSDVELQESAMKLFERGAKVRSPWVRSMSFASFGAAEVLKVDPTSRVARRLLGATRRTVDRPDRSKYWRWGEERLSYANAALPEAMLTVGSLLGDDRLIETGLRQLRWLLEMETPRGHLSVTPAGGRDPNGASKLFDQQPIEVASMSEACVRAYELTRDGQWRIGHMLCVEWFMGRNDLGVAMYDPDTGGGYDGLTDTGPNLNQGAESTIALLTTLQHARLFVRASS
ncbi:MAG TPA: hypothetical protein VND89_08275 [Acidimicrobiales bacterium]|nr:hypothetical protein [Acidimicrobiales bacterium]